LLLVVVAVLAAVKVAGVLFWGSRWFGGRDDGIDSGGADQGSYGSYGKSFKIIPIPCI
jgi:hypothetical protein